MESIRKFFRICEFVTQEALGSMARSAWMSWLVVVTIAVSLSILGGFWLIAQDLQVVARQMGSNVPIVVFLSDEANPRGVEEVLRQVPGIRSLKLISKEQAWRDMQQDMRARITFDNLLDQNPLPNSFTVQTENGDVTAAVAEQIKQIQGVEEISYGGDLLKKLQEFTVFIRTAGLAISAILGAASLAVIMNTIRLAVMARRREIEIMHLVGASNAFIAWPFLIEGMLFGLFGSLLTALALFAWRSFTFGKWQALLPFVPMRLDYVETMQVLACLTTVGMVLGAVGSALSVRRHIRLATAE